MRIKQPRGKNYLTRLTDARIAAAASEKRLRYALTQKLARAKKSGNTSDIRYKAEKEYQSKIIEIKSELARGIKQGNRAQAENEARGAFLAAQAQRRLKQSVANNVDGVEEDDLINVERLSKKAVSPLRDKKWFDFENKDAPGVIGINQRSEEFAEAVNMVDKFERQEAYRSVLNKAENGNFPTLKNVERVTIEREIKDGLQARFKAATPGENQYDPLAWFKSTSANHPNNIAYQEVRQNVASNPELKALDYLNPTQKEKPSTYFAAAAKALADERISVDKWMQKKIAEEYVTTGVGAIDQWQAKMRTGAGAALQHYGLAGDKSLDVLRKNHEEFKSRNAAAQQALLAASEANRRKLPPSSLSKEHQKLLKDAGFIENDGSGDTFVISTKNKKLRKLYGRQNADTKSNFILDTLDTISGESAVKIVVSQGASALAATRATGAVSTLVADLAADTVLDASYEAMSGKKVDFQRLIRDKAVQQLSSGAVGQTGSTLSKVFGSNKAQSSTKKLLNNLIGEGAESLIEETIIATSEGRDISAEQVAQSLVQNTFQKALTNRPDSYRVIENQINEAFGPGQAKERAEVLRLLKEAEDNRLRVNAEEKAAIDARFAKAIGPNGMKDVLAVAAQTNLKAATDEDFYGSKRFQNGEDRARNDALATKLLKASERGELSFNDISAKLAEDPNLKPVVEEYSVRRKKLSEKMVAPARKEALADIERESKRRLEQERLKSLDGQINPEIAAQIERWRAAEIDKVNTPLIAPGSQNPTSDIDRSTESTFLRKRLKESYRNTGAFGDAPAATSARTLDLNEYINVFTTINDTRATGSKLDDEVATGDYSGFTHGEAVEINSLRAAMRHMSTEQRLLYEKNKLDAIPETQTGERLRLQRKFDRARNLLIKTDNEVENKRVEIARQREQDGLPPLEDSDLTTAARDALYQDRTTELSEKKFVFDEAGRELDDVLHERAKLNNEVAQLVKQRDEVNKFLSEAKFDNPDIPAQRQKLAELNKAISEVPPFERDDQTISLKEVALIRREDDLLKKRHDLGAEMQREWGRTLGDGIETYASYTGLDAIVTQTQLTDNSIRDIINGKVKLKGDYSQAQITNAIDDQIMMITHHMNEFNEGHEGAPDAAKALGKYAERAVMFVQLKGGDLPESFNELSKLTEEMVTNRKDAEKLKAVMLKFAKEKTGKADLDVGIKELAKLIENTLPGAKGLFDPVIIRNEKKNNPKTYEQRRQLAQIYIRKERERENEIYGLQNGEQALADKIKGNIDRDKKRLANLEKQRDRHKVLSVYPMNKWADVEGLLGEQDRLEQRLRLASISTDDKPCQTTKCRQIQAEIEKIKDQLSDIKVPLDKNGNLVLSDEVKDILDRDKALVSEASEKIRQQEEELIKVKSKQAEKQLAGDPLKDLPEQEKQEEIVEFWSPDTPVEITISDDFISAKFLDASIQLRVE